MSEILGFIIIILGLCYLLFSIKAARDLDLIGRFLNIKKEIALFLIFSFLLLAVILYIGILFIKGE